MMNSEEITAWIKSFREALDDETATVKQRLAQLNVYGQALDIIEALEAQVASLNEKLTKRDEEVDSLTMQLQEERNLRLAIEMRFKEMSKLSVSRPEAALMAYMLAERLHIDQKWKFFEQLWQRKNMRNDYNTALEQRKSLDFQDRLKEILG